MGSRRLLDEYGTTRVWWHNLGDEVVIEHEHDVAPELDIARTVGEVGGPLVDSDGMRLQRIIPAHVMHRALVEGWVHDEAAWRRWANSGEGMVFAVEHNGRKQML